MDILKKIEDQYSLKELKWRKDAEIIETSTGLKRVRHWDDKVLLDWHIDWRDQVSSSDQLMIDRMIRTKKGEPAIQLENGWLTLHDDITTPYSPHEDEEKWALLLASMLNHGCSDHKEIKVKLVNQHSFSIDQCFKLLTRSKHIDGVAKILLKKSCYEAKKRISVANGLTKRCHKENLPIIDRINSVNQAKKIYNFFFWIGGSNYPDVGYRGVRLFLEEWYFIHGRNGIQRLLTQMNNHFDLTGEQGYFLLAECLIPWELQECLAKLQYANSEDEASITFEKYIEQWETSRKLVEVISGWIDEKREKVAT